MFSRGLLGLAVALAFLGSWAAKASLRPESARGLGEIGARCERIISMSPSVTEILFALGAGDRVVGVTDFCDYPPPARRKNRIGGYFNPNYEAVLALRPDLVILRTENREALRYLQSFDIPVLAVDHEQINGILDSIVRIGEVCGAEREARDLKASIEARVARVRRKTAGSARPTVLVSVGRTLGTGSVKEVYVAGKDGFYDRMIEWAGGRNAFQGSGGKYPLVSAEGILNMNPQVILDISAETETRDLEEDAVRREWDSIPSAEAVRLGRVHILGEDYVGIPGPRFVDTLEEIAKILHPEIDWSAP